MALRGRSVCKSTDRFLVRISVCSPQSGSQVRILVSGPRDETENYLKKKQKFESEPTNNLGVFNPKKLPG